MNHNEDNLLISSSEIKYWVYECHRYLFLTKIHFEDLSALPEINSDPLNYFESILNLSQISTDEKHYTNKLLFQETGEEPTLISIKDKFKFEFGLTDNEISKSKDIFMKISSKNWKSIEMYEIDEIENILCKILKSILDNLENIEMSQISVNA